MSRSTDPGHFFQTTTYLTESARKASKSKNASGNPIKLASKILAVAADPENNERVYVVEAAGTVRRVVLETAEISAIYTGPTAPLTSLCISTPSNTLFAGCWDKSIWSWSCSTRKPARRYQGHNDFVKAVLCLSLHGREILISGSADASIIVWDVGTKEKLHTLKGHTRGILALAIDQFTLPDPILHGTEQEKTDGGTVVFFSAGSDREIRRWSLTSTSALEASPASGSPSPILSHDTSVDALHFDADGDLWTASADKSAKCLSRQQNWEADTELTHPDFVRDVVVDEEGGWVATACRDEEVRVWEKGSGKLYHTFAGHFEEVTGLVLLPGQKLVSVSIDATIRQWSLKAPDLVKSRQDAEEERLGEKKEQEGKEKCLLTEDEERELADLMEESE